MIKIGFFIWSVNGFGGAERVMVYLCNYFAQKRYDVKLFLTSDDSKSDVYALEDNVKICCPGSDRTCTKIGKYDLLRREVKKFKPDVIISFEHIVNVIAIFMGSMDHIPVIVSERNVPDSFDKITRFLMRCTYWRASYLVVQTEEIKQLIRFYSRKCVVIPNPVDAAGNEKISYQASHKIVAVGRFVEAKNYRFLINVFREFHDIHQKYILDIYGDGVLIDEIRNMISELKLEGLVNLKGNHANIKELLTDYDFYVLASNYEGQPNALLEAMAVGLPCICTKFDGGGYKVIENGYNGICVEKENGKQLLGAMNEMALSEEKRKTCGQNAKKIVEEYGIENIMNQWKKYILKCMEYSKYAD